MASRQGSTSGSSVSTQTPSQSSSVSRMGSSWQSPQLQDRLLPLRPKFSWASRPNSGESLAVQNHGWNLLLLPERTSACRFLTSFNNSPSSFQCQGPLFIAQSSPHQILPAALHISQRCSSAGRRSRAHRSELVLKKAESTKGQKRQRERNG